MGGVWMLDIACGELEFALFNNYPFYGVVIATGVVMATNDRVSFP